MREKRTRPDSQSSVKGLGPRWAQWSAVVGALVWLALLLLFNTDREPFDLRIIRMIFLLGALVVVPLGLSLVATPDRHNRHALFYRLALLAQPFGAAMAVCSYLFEQGMTAAMLASVWLIVTAFVSMFGIVRFLPRGWTRAEEVAIDAGLIYLSVGGLWFVLSRFGLQPLGFGDTIVLLTAIHFHYAGFAAPILVGLAGRTLDDTDRRAKRLLKIISIAVIGGTPLVAAGITFSPWMALAGAILIASGLLLLAALVINRVVPRLHARAGARLMLLISSASSIFAMILACVYAYSIVARRLLINIPQMAMFHGVANALGFSLCGLIAWCFIRPEARSAPPGVPFSRLYGRRFVGPDYFQQIKVISSSKAQPDGLVDDLSLYRRAEDFDPDLVHPDVRAFYERTRQYGLLVRPRWRRGFRLGGLLAQTIGGLVGQMRLPVTAEHREDRIETRMLPIEDAFDGREGVRAWVRTYEGTKSAMYVAAYATHSLRGNTYMNIAFPYPGGNVSSILHISYLEEGKGRKRGIVLSTLPRAHVDGDQGVYFANRLLPVRLPINETITVWAAEEKGDAPFNVHITTENVRVLARHEMWLCGVKFLELDYEIFPSEQETKRREINRDRQDGQDTEEA